MKTLSPVLATLDEVLLLTVVLFGEARGEPVEGQIGIANVIRNRVKTDLLKDNKPDWWGEGYHGVISCWAQFSCLWPELGGLNYQSTLDYAQGVEKLPASQLSWVAEGIFYDEILDNTHGATHYHNYSVFPAWAKTATMCCRLGSHIFYTGVK